MSNASEPMFPCSNPRGDIFSGLTKREYFAGLAMQGILSGKHPITTQDHAEYKVADAAIDQADAILERLSK